MSLWINGRKVYDTPYVVGTITLVNGDIDLSTSGTGTYDIILKDAVANALRFRRGSTAMIDFDTSTPKITITPALTVSGLLTAAAALTVSAGDVSVSTGELYVAADLKKIYLGTSIGNRTPMCLPLTAADTPVVGEVYVLSTTVDTGITAGGVGGNESHPGVIVRGTSLVGWIAVRGIAGVDCDTAAVARGDILVTSNATAKKAMTNNAQTDPSKIIGIALEAKGAGAAGQVKALIR